MTISEVIIYTGTSTCIWDYRHIISNDASFCQKHRGVPDGSDGSDKSSYAVTENYTLPVAYVPPLHCSDDVYAPSERHVCYTLRKGCSYAEAVYTTPGDVHAFLRLSATLYLPPIAIYRRPHSSDICFVLRCCHLFQYSLRFRYIACRCICFAIIVFYRSPIYCPIFTLSSTMPSVLHILR